MRLRFAVLTGLVLGILAAGLQPLPASAQGVDTLLDNPVCREDPYSEDCICAEVRQVAMFPLVIDPSTRSAVDSDSDTFAPTETDGVWRDHPDEAVAGLASELVYVQTDEYGQQCAMSYWRENQRRLWVFGVSVAAVFTVIGMVMVGITYMQHSASGMDLSRARLQLIRIFIGVVIVACSMLVWEGVNAFLFSNLESWTFERGVFYDFR